MLDLVLCASNSALADYVVAKWRSPKRKDMLSVHNTQT